MITEYTIASARAQIRQWRADGARVGLVATMGNLHEGHLSLARAASSQSDRVVASIFVNPLQFGPTEDFAAYPRTLDADRAALESVQCDLLFAPTTEEIYPDGESSTRVTVGALGGVLYGAHRAGHFDGMATVVTKLLNIIQPNIAVFGEKDFQQLVVIRRIVQDLNLPVQIQGVSTMREADGLAMSSRNRYLEGTERDKAPQLYATLSDIAEQIRNGDHDYQRLCNEGAKRLVGAGFKPDYVEVRDADTLHDPVTGTRSVVVLAAAILGRARLIDNIRLELEALSQSSRSDRALSS